MIISLFGPDGVGKSTASSQLNKPGWTVFSGTNVASWPDQEWHQHFIHQHIDESTITEDAHFVEKISRAYALARKLEATIRFVVIDSDPLHKTIIHDYLRLLPDVPAARRRMRQRFDLFKQHIGYNSRESIHVCFQISSHLSEDEQAAACLARLANRTTLAFFDPKDIAQSLARVRATEELKRLIAEDGDSVLSVTTDKPFDDARFYADIERLTL